MGKPPYSYKPVRGSFPDLLGLETPLFGAADPVQFEKIRQVIVRASKSAKEEAANLAVAAGLYAERWRGHPQPFGSMGTTIGQRLTYWTPAVLVVDGRPIVPFINPRRQSLPPHGRRFVFSMMHEQIRVPNPDYADVALCICHFAVTKDGDRIAKPCFDAGMELFSFDELQSMVAETYAIWAEVWAGRVEDIRRQGNGGGGVGI
jgi:hypothetical protein